MIQWNKKKTKIVICYLIPLNGSIMKEKLSYLNVRWYLKYPLSYRNLKEMMIKRGIQVDHSTIIMRWVHQYSPEIEKKIRRHSRLMNYS
jgi:IS6 family transposase